MCPGSVTRPCKISETRSPSARNNEKGGANTQGRPYQPPLFFCSGRLSSRGERGRQLLFLYHPGHSRVSGNVADNRLQSALDVVQRPRKGDALQYDTAGAFLSHLREVYPEDDPQLTQDRGHFLHDLTHAELGQTRAIGEKVCMDPEFFTAEDFHASGISSRGRFATCR